MSLDLEVIKARDAALREDGEAWSCKYCEWCSGCNMLRTCEAHDDDGDVPALVAEVERLREEVRHIERTRHSNRVLAAEVERLRGQHA